MQVWYRFNWGYDPVHYGVPEGSYASNPDGPARILEYRKMVQALHRLGFRVVLDVVYNHTFHAGGQCTCRCQCIRFHNEVPYACSIWMHASLWQIPCFTDMLGELQTEALLRLVLVTGVSNHSGECFVDVCALTGPTFVHLIT